LYLSDLCHIKPELSGDDLIKLGYRPGKKLGQALEKIKDAKLDGTINSREGEISLAKELLREQ
jgi:tRNA nucleotidyltransferase (CCA-adding enzyme)